MKETFLIFINYSPNFFKICKLNSCEFPITKFLFILVKSYFFWLKSISDPPDSLKNKIPGSHSKCLKRHIVTDRYDSKDIEANYKKKIYTGNAGSLFFVDTFGIHKGSTAIDNFRKVIFLEYGKGHVELSKNAIFL